MSLWARLLYPSTTTRTTWKFGAIVLNRLINVEYNSMLTSKADCISDLKRLPIPIIIIWPSNCLLLSRTWRRNLLSVGCVTGKSRIKTLSPSSLSCITISNRQQEQSILIRLGYLIISTNIKPPRLLTDIPMMSKASSPHAMPLQSISTTGIRSFKRQTTCCSIVVTSRFITG